MKKALSLFFLVCIVIFSTAYAQRGSLDDYKKIDYIEVKDGKLGSFLKLSENQLQAKYRQLIEAGVIKSWALYHTKFPGGEKNRYNFISIATTSDINKLIRHFNDPETPLFIPSSKSNSKPAKINKISRMVKSEIWKVENQLSSDDTTGQPGKYLSMDYMKVAPGKHPDYLMLEDEIAKPIHEERIKNGTMAGWQVYSLLTPDGLQYDYNFSTGNYFDRLSDIEFGFTNEVINQAMSGKNANISELFSTIYSTRDMVRVEVWELYLFAH